MESIRRHLGTPFDGHGYLRSFAFNDDGSVDVKARFIETESYNVEAEKNDLIVRGFATNPHDQFWKKSTTRYPQKCCQHHHLPLGRQTDCRMGRRRTSRLDPNTLDTYGVETFNELIAGKTTLAHMHHDPVDDTLILVNLTMGRYTELEIHEVNSTDECIRSRHATIPHTAFVHDFTFSRNWVIFGGNNLSIKPLSFMKQMMGAGTMLTSIKTNTSADGEMILVPRRSTDDIRRIRLPKPIYVVHFVNAFEQEDGTLIVDACIFHDFPFGEEFGYTGKHTPFDPLLPDQREAQRMYRITIPPHNDEGTWEMLSPYGIDFPRVPGAECGQNARYMVGATRSDAIHSDPFDSIIVVDLHNPDHPAQTWSTSTPSLWESPSSLQIPTEKTTFWCC